jgi:inosine-uridine nucleoside N-ribohydrolase
MLLAHGSPAIELLAVTTVAGNQTLEKVTRNALAVAELAGMVPIAAGCARPLVRKSKWHLPFMATAAWTARCCRLPLARPTPACGGPDH